MTTWKTPVYLALGTGGIMLGIYTSIKNSMDMELGFLAIATGIFVFLFGVNDILKERGEKR